MSAKQDIIVASLERIAVASALANNQAAQQRTSGDFANQRDTSAMDLLREQNAELTRQRDQAVLASQRDQADLVSAKARTMSSAVQPVRPAAVECGLPRVHTMLRFMGMDGGRDFFNHMITWDKKARAEKRTILEVGAGDGRQATAAAGLGYNVISVDAAGSNLAQGKQILAKAKSTAADSGAPFEGDVTWIHSAVSNYTGTTQFLTQLGIGRMLDGKPGDVADPANPKWKGQTQSVPVNKLDDLVAKFFTEQPPFIFKVDVEGQELNVLLGAEKVLDSRPPIVILEWNPSMIKWGAKQNAVDILMILHRRGYVLYDSGITEPGKKGFVNKYGAFHRPVDFEQLAQWFRQSEEFDWWGSWTDIVAIDPSFH